MSTGEDENGAVPLTQRQLVAKVEDRHHDGEELARRRHDRARQRPVIGDHSEDEKLRHDGIHQHLVPPSLSQFDSLLPSFI